LAISINFLHVAPSPWNHLPYHIHPINNVKTQLSYLLHKILPTSYLCSLAGRADHSLH
jgi:hypothetical protein